MAREKGVVKWFSTEKGYGFVRRENGEEVFVHHSDIDVEGYASLHNGESVEFEIFESDRGPKARKLVSLERAASAGGERRTARHGAESGRSRARSRSEEQAAERVTAPESLADQLRDRLGGRFPGFGG